MAGKDNTILIPWDFTHIAEYAYEHALIISQRIGNDIALVHIVKNENEIDEANKKLVVVADELQKKNNVPVKAVVRAGSIFTTIGELATELEANLVIMGTHGIRGMQKLTGSWALKVIVNSEVPFIVVQDKPQNSRMQNVVFPVDFQRETREKLNWVYYLAKHYHCKIHIFKRTDPTLRKNIEGNIQFAKKYLQQHEIDYEIITQKGKDPFPVETIHYSKEIKADLILIMTSRNLGFADFVMGPDEQYIIANSAKVPVMCINPRPVTLSGGFRAGGG